MQTTQHAASVETAHRGFRHVDTWIFDLDNTLYPASCRLFDQVSTRIGDYVSQFLGIDRQEAHRVQKEFFYQYGTTMNGMMHVHGMEPGPFLDYVHDIDYSPVQASPALVGAIDALPGRKLIYTNGSVAHAEAVLDRLGLAGRFETIFDIVAGDYKPKPHAHGYDKLERHAAVAPTQAAFFEDMAKNLLEPHRRGMTTVLVKTEDSYARAGEQDAHVHHRTEDLARFLARLRAAGL